MANTNAKPYKTRAFVFSCLYHQQEFLIPRYNYYVTFQVHDAVDMVVTH